jgi:hypothetical protein
MNYILRDKRNPMTREERKEYMKKYNAERREYLKEYHSKWRSEHREEFNSGIRKRSSEDLNKNGLTKNSIRIRSGKILGKCHAKLEGYEIHHCFGYEDPGKFIYIPRELHQKIHQFLRDKHIQADIDHFNTIRGLISSYPGYTYIRS